MRIIWDNEIDKHTLAFNSEQSAYPTGNIQDYQLTKKYRSIGDADEWIIIDAGAGNTIIASCAGIIAHNLTSGAVCKIQAHEDNTHWGDPTVNETFTNDTGIMTKYFTEASQRFWRFHFADATNPDEYIEIGRLEFGTFLQIDIYSREISIIYEDTSTVDDSLTGQSFGDPGIIRRLYYFIFPYWNNTKRKEIIVMLKDIKKVKPIILVPDENNTDKMDIVYCRLNDNISINHIIDFQWNGVMAFKEVF